MNIKQVYLVLALTALGSTSLAADKIGDFEIIVTTDEMTDVVSTTAQTYNSDGVLTIQCETDKKKAVGLKMSGPKYMSTFEFIWALSRFDMEPAQKFSALTYGNISSMPNIKQVDIPENPQRFRARVPTATGVDVMYRFKINGYHEAAAIVKATCK